ncbi:MAG: hypothetical protein LBT10_09165 [Methanobrevibacter sp.]|jgi:hypothetical protein|nr:hypothetical protein [Methanobrevibacter sp.]
MNSIIYVLNKNTQVVIAEEKFLDIKAAKNRKYDLLMEQNDNLEVMSKYGLLWKDIEIRGKFISTNINLVNANPAKQGHSDLFWYLVISGIIGLLMLLIVSLWTRSLMSGLM